MSVAEKTDLKPSDADHREAESRIVKFSYTKPEGYERAKVSVRLGDTGLLRGHIQVIKAEGGENNMHYHSKVDGMFTVLKGRLRFYGPPAEQGGADEVLGEFGPLEGIFIPKNARYWFENTSGEEAELMLVQGFHEFGSASSGRTDSSPRKLKDAGADDATNQPRYTAMVK